MIGASVEEGSKLYRYLLKGVHNSDPQQQHNLLPHHSEASSRNTARTQEACETTVEQHVIHVQSIRQVTFDSYMNERLSKALQVTTGASLQQAVQLILLCPGKDSRLYSYLPDLV